MINLNNIDFSNGFDLLYELLVKSEYVEYYLIGLRYIQSEWSKLLIIVKKNKYEIYCLDLKTSIIDLLNKSLINSEIYLTIPINNNLLFIADKDNIAIINGTFDKFEVELPHKRLLLIYMIISSNMCERFLNTFATINDLSIDELIDKFESLNANRILLKLADTQIIPIDKMLAHIILK